jgi:hypothetical protein
MSRVIATGDVRMPMFLFRCGDNPIEYCATDSRSGHKLPDLHANARWLYHAELQNAVHAAVFGVMNFELAKRSILQRGYLRYTDNRILKNGSYLPE